MRRQRHAHYRLKQAQPAASGGHGLPKRRGTFRGRVGEAACYSLEEPDRAKAYITLTAQALKSSPISFVMNVNLRVTRVDIKDRRVFTNDERFSPRFSPYMCTPSRLVA